MGNTGGDRARYTASQLRRRACPGEISIPPPPPAPKKRSQCPMSALGTGAPGSVLGRGSAREEADGEALGEVRRLRSRRGRAGGGGGGAGAARDEGDRTAGGRARWSPEGRGRDGVLGIRWAPAQCGN